MNQKKRKFGAHGSKFWRETSVTSCRCARFFICTLSRVTKMMARGNQGVGRHGFSYTKSMKWKKIPSTFKSSTSDGSKRRILRWAPSDQTSWLSAGFRRIAAGGVGGGWDAVLKKFSQLSCAFSECKALFWGFRIIHIQTSSWLRDFCPSLWSEINFKWQNFTQCLPKILRPFRSRLRRKGSDRRFLKLVLIGLESLAGRI